MSMLALKEIGEVIAESSSAQAAQNPFHRQLCKYLNLRDR